MLIGSLLGTPLDVPARLRCLLVFMVLVIAGMSNFVNLTDGLDGLAIGLMIIAAGAMTVWRTSAVTLVLPDYLDSARLPGAAELDDFAAP